MSFLRFSPTVDLSATPADRPNRRRRALLGGVIAVAIAAAGATAMASNALWVDKAQVSGSKFTAGTVKLTAGPAAPVLWKVNGYPGYSQVTPITVTNTGSMAMRYAVTGYETGGMAPVLKIEAKAGVTSCTAAGFTATGTSILAAKTLTVNTETALIGSTVAGAQSGDRTLAVGASEVLCFRITEDTSAGNAYMSTTGTLRLTVTGEQTKNN